MSFSTCHPKQARELDMAGIIYLDNYVIITGRRRVSADQQDNGGGGQEVNRGTWRKGRGKIEQGSRTGPGFSKGLSLRVRVGGCLLRQGAWVEGCTGRRVHWVKGCTGRRGAHEERCAGRRGPWGGRMHGRRAKQGRSPSPGCLDPRLALVPPVQPWTRPFALYVCPDSTLG